MCTLFVSAPFYLVFNTAYSFFFLYNKHISSCGDMVYRRLNVNSCQVNHCEHDVSPHIKLNAMQKQNTIQLCRSLVPPLMFPIVLLEPSLSHILSSPYCPVLYLLPYILSTTVQQSHIKLKLYNYLYIVCYLHFTLYIYEFQGCILQTSSVIIYQYIAKLLYSTLVYSYGYLLWACHL